MVSFYRCACSLWSWLRKRRRTTNTTAHASQVLCLCFSRRGACTPSRPPPPAPRCTPPLPPRRQPAAPPHAAQPRRPACHPAEGPAQGSVVQCCAVAENVKYTTCTKCHCRSMAVRYPAPEAPALRPAHLVCVRCAVPGCGPQLASCVVHHIQLYDIALHHLGDWARRRWLGWVRGRVVVL